MTKLLEIYMSTIIVETKITWQFLSRCSSWYLFEFYYFIFLISFLKILPNYLKQIIHLFMDLFQGQDSMSDYPITFHYVSTDQMYDLEYYIYHLRAYGIVVRDVNLNAPAQSDATTQGPRHVTPSTAHPSPNVQQPSVQQPNFQQLSIQQPNFQQPIVQQPNLQQPSVQQPNVQQPSVHQPDSQQTNFQQPNAQQPNFQQSSAQQPHFQQHNVQQDDAKQPNVFNMTRNVVTWQEFWRKNLRLLTIDY